MQNQCYTGTDVPEKLEEACGGNYTLDQCIIHASAISYLELPTNSSLMTIINTFVLALMAKDDQIAELDARITALEP